MIRYSLKQLTYFVAAAEKGSVTEAARTLNVAQPSVSAAIAHLEQVFAVQLFIRRHAQGLSLTPAGRRIAAEARELLSHAGELMSRSWDDTGDVRGELHLGCFVTFSPYYVPGLLRVFKERHPNVTVRLHEGDADALQRGIASGTLDVALVYDMALGAEFGRETLAELRPYALLPCDHALAEQEQVSLAALAAEPIVLLDLPISGAYFRSIFLRAGLEPEARYRTASFEMVRGLVANGHGVAILNLRLPQDRSYDGRPFAIRRLADPVPPLRIVLARLRRARMTRAAEVFAACARDYFSRVASVDRPFAE